jgi:DNA-binding transcriptional LysR family regulator
MSKAAATLGLAQPSVSARIRQLEDDLGAPLSRRNARGVELTDAGRRFLDYAERSLALIEEGRPEVREASGASASPASLAESLFPHIGPKLLTRDLELWMSTNHSPQALEMLLDARVDAGICLAGPTLLVWLRCRCRRCRRPRVMAARARWRNGDAT